MRQKYKQTSRLPPLDLCGSEVKIRYIIKKGDIDRNQIPMKTGNNIDNSSELENNQGKYTSMT